MTTIWKEGDRFINRVNNMKGVILKVLGPLFVVHYDKRPADMPGPIDTVGIDSLSRLDK